MDDENIHIKRTVIDCSFYLPHSCRYAGPHQEAINEDCVQEELDEADKRHVQEKGKNHRRR